MIALSGYTFSALQQSDVTLHRGRQDGHDPILLAVPASENPPLELIRRLEREYALRADLDPLWAAQPLELTDYHGRPALVLRDPGGVPLDRLIGPALSLRQFLAIAFALAGAC